MELTAPFSAGSGMAKLARYADACDCHMHIYDNRFAPSPHWSKVPPQAPVEAYRLLQKRLGTTRAVVVTPSTYGIDNSCIVDALAQLGQAARGVAVVDTDISDAELQRLAKAGVCGIRVNFVSAQSWGITTGDRLQILAERVHELGWHVQILMTALQIADMESLLTGLPANIVIDHMGRLPQPQGTTHSAFQVILKLLAQGKTWVKLSGAYMDTAAGPPGYQDVGEVAKALITAAPERMLWGSDWPHPTETEKPDDALLLDLLQAWTDDEAVIRKILVDNPAAVYGF